MPFSSFFTNPSGEVCQHWLGLLKATYDRGTCSTSIIPQRRGILERSPRGSKSLSGNLYFLLSPKGEVPQSPLRGVPLVWVLSFTLCYFLFFCLSPRDTSHLLCGGWLVGGGGAYLCGKKMPFPGFGPKRTIDNLSFQNNHLDHWTIYF